MTPARAAAAVGALLGVDPGPARRLSGGLLNHVFRVEIPGGSVILKQAPPHVASAPEIPLDPSRAAFEARALATCGGVPGPGLASPRLLAHADGLVIMEDLGDGLPLDRALLDRPDLLDRLGHGLRALHARTPPGDLHNLPVQQTRLAVQYRAVGPALARADVADAAALGATAEALGERLLAPGDAWVHGDLWPPSVLVIGDRLALIDWELSTVGRRCQDLGHLLAHLWMGAHRRHLGADLGRRFLAAYGDLSPDDRAETAIHFGCEILARTVGAFQGGGPYDGLGVDDPALQQAVATAAGALRTRALPT